MHENLPDSNQLHPWLNHQGKGELGNAHKDLEELLTASSELQVPKSLSKEEAWDLLEAKIAAETPIRHLRPKSRPILMAAASLVLLFSIGFWWMNQSDAVNISTQRAEHKTVNLPDGSQVQLNAVSQVSYDAASWDEERKVVLEGEAFFDVKKGSTFQVQTSQGTVTVLGTSFNVYSREDRFETNCLTGKVEVQANASGKRILEAGQAWIKAAHSDTETDIFELETEKIGSWKKGKVYFENTLLIDVIAVLERQFDVTFEFPGLDSIPCYGWTTPQDLDLTLKTTFRPLGIQYQLTEEGHILLLQAAKVDVED